jgi:SAM-dependent methyltransferase
VVSTDTEVKARVQEFYDQVGWQEVSDGVYQNARYEDLRHVSREYIHRCHLRVQRHLAPVGRCLLDAGSGPIQYPEYVEYSRGYRARVCVDISIVALQEARKRIGDVQSGGHGTFVVADIANLPFKQEAFSGMVSLHTIHHLPREEHPRAYQELYRTLERGAAGVVVNGWDSPPLTRLLDVPVRLVERLYARVKGKQASTVDKESAARNAHRAEGTYVRKSSAAWLKSEVGREIPLKIWVWRTVNVRFLRTLIHPRWGGRQILRLLYALEERFPHYFGKNGQYPLVVIRKPGS